MNKQDITTLEESCDYLILKTYFIVPYFPVFKPSTLRRDFNFAVYIKYCLLEKLRYLFKFSWTCWIFFMFAIFLWSVVVVPNTIEFSVNLK